MSNLGLGVMINMLGGNEESVKTFQKAVGKTISNLEIKNDELIFVFTDGYSMKLFDDGQSCCENRYMMTSDDLSSFIGSQLLEAETASAPNIGDDEYGEHEVQFLKVKTSLGVFTVETHNEHNGYYGGFWVIAKEIKDA